MGTNAMMNLSLVLKNLLQGDATNLPRNDCYTNK